jgi:hypothetical protein
MWRWARSGVYAAEKRIINFTVQTTVRSFAGKEARLIGCELRTSLTSQPIIYKTFVTTQVDRLKV